ncbi:hypothetical protein [Roseateles sp.]|uniref:hypothetical protein n=1 Tax=Roseateles sp. TaxID=1971397 RepID=UPI0031D7BEE5
MSSVARWAYTATATVWPFIDRADWGGVAQYGPPSTFACGYASKADRMTDAKGIEFITKQVLYTERDDIKQQDMVLIGDHSGQSDPIAAGAAEVRVVSRDQDVFEGKADDFTVYT